MPKTINRQLPIELAMGGAARASAYLAAFAFTFVGSRFLDNDRFDLIVTSWAVANVVAVFILFGAEQELLRLPVSSSRSQSWRKIAWPVNIRTVAALLVLPGLQRLGLTTDIAVLGALLIIATQPRLLEADFRIRSERLKAASGASLLSGLALLGAVSFGAASTEVLWASAALFLIWAAARSRRPVALKPAVREAHGAAVWFFLYGLGSQLMLFADTLFVSRYGANAGAYFAVNRYAGLVVLPLTVLLAMRTDALLGDLSGSDSDAVSGVGSGALRSITSTSRTMGLVAAVSLAMLWPLFAMLYGIDGLLAPLLLLLAGYLASAWAGPVAFVLNSSGQRQFVALAVGGAAMANLVLNFLLVPIWGATGAALGTACSTAVWNLTLRRKVDRLALGRAA